MNRGRRLLEAGGPERQTADEVRLRPSERERLRGAVSGAWVLALLMVPVGAVMALLTGTFAWLVVLEMWALVSVALSYFGQGHNAVFVGNRGIRRVVHGCTITARWPGLTAVEVRVPGRRLVDFQVLADDLQIERTGWGGRRQQRMLEAHPPDGLRVRLDRATADALISLIRERRPGLRGLEDWERDSHPSSSRDQR